MELYLSVPYMPSWLTKGQFSFGLTVEMYAAVSYIAPELQSNTAISFSEKGRTWHLSQLCNSAGSTIAPCVLGACHLKRARSDLRAGHGQLVLSPFLHILSLLPSSSCLIISVTDNRLKRIALLFNNFRWRQQMQLLTFQFV